MDGYDPLDYEPSNIWRCFTNSTGKYCYPLGDVRLGLELGLAQNLQYVHADVYATYNSLIETQSRSLLLPLFVTIRHQ